MPYACRYCGHALSDREYTEWMSKPDVAHRLGCPRCIALKVPLKMEMFQKRERAAELMAAADRDLEEITRYCHDRIGAVEKQVDERDVFSIPPPVWKPDYDDEVFWV